MDCTLVHRSFRTSADFLIYNFVVLIGYLFASILAQTNFGVPPFPTSWCAYASHLNDLMRSAHSSNSSYSRKLAVCRSATLAPMYGRQPQIVEKQNFKHSSLASILIKFRGTDQQRKLLLFSIAQNAPFSIQWVRKGIRHALPFKVKIFEHSYHSGVESDNGYLELSEFCKSHLVGLITFPK